MSLIVGSKNESKALMKLIYKEEHQLEKYYGREEVFAIRAWIDKQPHLPDISDDHIILFLHCKQFSIERTKRVIENYFTMRTHAPHIFTKRKPGVDIELSSINSVYFAFFPPECKTYDGSHVMLFRLRHSDATVVNQLPLWKLCSAMFDLQMAKMPLANGYHVIFDAVHLHLGHFLKSVPSLLKTGLMYLQRGCPARIKMIHVLNASPIAQQFLEIGRPLSKSHYLDKIKFYSASEVHVLTDNYIPKSSMPSDYGGGSDTLEKMHNTVYEELLLAEDWISELEEIKVDERMRIGRPKTCSDIYGMEGSFRQLAID